MGHVEFEAKQRGRSLNVTYTDLEDEGTVHFEMFVPDGSLGMAFGARTVAELHDSLGAWLELRKKAQKEARVAKKQASREGRLGRRASARAGFKINVPVVREEPVDPSAKPAVSEETTTPREMDRTRRGR